MSEDREADDKITVLFPDRDDDQSAEQHDGDHAGGDDAPGEDSTDAPDNPDPGDQPTGEGDNVVRLDFAGDTDGSSDDDQHAEGLPSIEGMEVQEAKLRVFRRMIDKGMVMVTLDTRFEGVEVPPKFQGLPELRLNFSHMFHIDDFDYDPSGVRASLSFDGTRYFCDVPWEAVFMLYGHESGDVLVFEPPESE